MRKLKSYNLLYLLLEIFSRQRRRGALFKMNLIKIVFFLYIKNIGIGTYKKYFIVPIFYIYRYIIIIYFLLGDIRVSLAS